MGAMGTGSHSGHTIAPRALATNFTFIEKCIVRSHDRGKGIEHSDRLTLEVSSGEARLCCF